MKIGIIGAGASGLVTAWLLDETCDVVVFEKNNRLGGHVNTHYVQAEGKSIPIETGFEFFDRTLFPHFIKLLNILAIETHPFKANATFYTNDKTFLLPPIRFDTFFWKSLLPQNIWIFLQFKYVLIKSRHFIHSGNKTIILVNFVDSLYVTRKFKNNFLYPFLSAQWGFDVSIFKKSVAYDILSWFIKREQTNVYPTEWEEIVGGASSYINALANQISNSKIITNAIIIRITYQNDRYNIQLADGATYEFDHLILATNAQEASQLLENIEHTQKTRESLKKVNYTTASIAIHSDKSFMPKDRAYWAEANIYSDGIEGYLTTYKYWKSETPIFRSWIFPHRPHFRLPEHLFALKHYHHPNVDIHYFENQHFIKSIQGQNNIWFGGLYTHDIDSHESAIISAIEIAKKLAPHSKRLTGLLS